MQRCLNKYRNSTLALIIMVVVLYALKHSFKNVHHATGGACQCEAAETLQGVGNGSTCSDAAATRGRGHKVVSFTVFGKVENYQEGIEQNLEAIKRFYPGYVMRLYHDAQRGAKSFDLLCSIACQHPDLDLCNVKHAGVLGDISAGFGMVWRFAPMVDPLVEEWHSRDLDSVITAREAAAVQDWKYNSSAVFHFMRDNPYQGLPVLAGLFGMRAPKQDKDGHFRRMNDIWDRILTGSITNPGRQSDQDLLRRHLWPAVTRDGVGTSGLAHDSYTCDTFRKRTLVRPFPTQRLASDDFLEGRPNNFVGSNGGSIGLSQGSIYKCPLKCRPPDHLDWLLC